MPLMWSPLVDQCLCEFEVDQSFKLVRVVNTCQVHANLSGQQLFDTCKEEARIQSVE